MYRCQLNGWVDILPFLQYGFQHEIERDLPIYHHNAVFGVGTRLISIRKTDFEWSDTGTGFWAKF
jgi:hypothetical protein